MNKYKHGGDCYRNQIDYDFSVSINPLGIPKAGYLAACESAMHLERYPDDKGEALCLALAGKEGILPENILLGNGETELIYALCHYVRPKKALASSPCFEEYGRAVQAAGGEMIYDPLKESSDFCLDEDFLSVIGKETELVFLCNPGNPAGRDLALSG